MRQIETQGHDKRVILYDSVSLFRLIVFRYPTERARYSQGKSNRDGPISIPTRPCSLILLESIPIVRVILNSPSLPIGLSILPLEPPIHESHENHQEELRRDGAPHAGSITRVLLLHEAARGVDATDGCEEHLDAAGDGTPGCASDVVGLKGDDGGEVGVAAGDAEEDSYMS